MTYVHLRRKDDSNLIYRVEICTNLLSAAWGTSGVSILQTNPVDATFEEVVNGIPSTNWSTYVRLKVIDE